MKLECPLNEALPNTEHARDRLLARIFTFRKEEKERAGADDEDFELLYAYGMCCHWGFPLDLFFFF